MSAGGLQHKDVHSSEDMSQGGGVTGLEAGGAMVCAASDSGLSSLGSISAAPRPRTGSRLTPNTVKKSFTTGVSNISSLMGKIKNKLDPDDIDDCDR